MSLKKTTERLEIRGDPRKGHLTQEDLVEASSGPSWSELKLWGESGNEMESGAQKPGGGGMGRRRRRLFLFTSPKPGAALCENKIHSLVSHEVNLIPLEVFE